MSHYPHGSWCRILTLLPVLTLCLLAGLPQRAVAETWSLLTYAPTANTLSDIYSPDGGATTYIVGDGGLILKKTGTTYTQMATGVTAPLLGIHGRGPSDIWAVGGSAATGSTTDPTRSVLLHFDGTSWTPTTPPQLPGNPDLSTIDDVWVSATGQAHAVSTMSAAPIKWNASQEKWEFETVSVPQGARGDYTLRAIYGFGDDDVYAVGSLDTILHNDGNGWTVVSQHEPTEGTCTRVLQNVWGPSAAAVFAGGNCGQLYRWQPSVAPGWMQVNQASPWLNAGNMQRMAGTGPDDIWFVGGGNVFMQHWTGNVDNLSRVIEVPPKTRYAISLNDSGHYLLAGERGLLEDFNPADETRQALNTPPRVDTFWLAAAFSGRLWLAPMTTDAATGVYTWDGGRMTRHPIAGLPDSSSVRTFRVFSTTDMWFSSKDNNTLNGVIKRGNGTSWTDWTIPGTSGNITLLDVAKTISGDYVVLQQGEALGLPCFVGNSAPTCLQGGAEAYAYSALAASPNGDVHAVGAGGQVALWRDGAWSVTTVGDNGDDLTAVAATDGMVVAVGVNGSAFYSTNGTTWQPVAGITREVAPETNATFKYFLGITHAGDGVFWASLYAGENFRGTGLLYRIENGTGVMEQGGFTEMITGLCASPSQSAVFAVGSNGLIMTTNPDFTETIPGASSPSLFLLLDR